MPRIITMHCNSAGSSTLTTWKRRASAGSFSKYFLYSDHVVAAMVRNSPRANAGFRRLAASFWPAWPPAPIMVCASSMNRMMGTGEDFDFFNQSFEAIFKLALDARAGLQQSQIQRADRDVLQGRRTSPCATRSAKPSTTAVLPTPASPVRMGLFCRRRMRISMTWRISKSRPSTGSILPLWRSP